MELTLPIKIILAFTIGALIGLERQFHERGIRGKEQMFEPLVGVRSLALIGIFGALAGILFINYLFLSLFIALTFLCILIAFYYFDSKQTLDYGITTELAMFATFILGALIGLNALPIQLILAMSVVLLLLLSRKERIQRFTSAISSSELNAFVSYAIIALVILPFLPNETYALSDIPFIKAILTTFALPYEQVAMMELFNPFKVWLIVALITGIDIIGYVLEKTLGQKRGWLLASIAGGFISSTATTQSLAQESKLKKNSAPLVAAAVVANVTSFFQIGVIILAVNSFFFVKLLPTLLCLIIGGSVVAAFFLLKKGSQLEKQTDEEMVAHDIFNLVPALKFALLFLIITIVSKLSLAFLGEGGFLITTALGALAGLDAVMINTAQLAGNSIDYRLAVSGFLIANAINLSAKSLYSFLQGERTFAKQFGLGMLVIILSSLLGLVFV